MKQGPAGDAELFGHVGFVALADFVAVHARHHYVEQHHSRFELLNKPSSLKPVVGRQDFQARDIGREQRSQEIVELTIVV